MIYAGTKGHLDKIPIVQVREWEKKFLVFMRDQKAEIHAELADKMDLDDSIIEKIEASIAEFQAQFASTHSTD